MQIKGKQLKDNTITQTNLNITTDSIVSVSAVTNAEYVNTTSINRVQSLCYSTLNMNMSAKNATVGQLACDSFIIEFPISNVMVSVNNIGVEVGENGDCYFSPDGIIIRTGGNALKGDYLYWNSTRFNLDTTDEIDFVYITAKQAVILVENTTVEIDPFYPSLNVKYTGIEDSTMTVMIENVSFIVGNVAGSFVWDIGGSNEHTFTYVGESHPQQVNANEYTIWFDGFGSLLYSIKKTSVKNSMPLIFISLLSPNMVISTQVDQMVYDNNNLYILTTIQSESYSATIYKYSNATNTWIKMSTPMGYNNQYSYNDFTVKNDIIYINGFYRTDESDNQTVKIVKSTDNGFNWNILHSQSEYIPHFEYVNSNVMYNIIRVNYVDYGHVFGLDKSVDGGTTWTTVNNNVCHGNHTILFTLNENIMWMYGTEQAYINSTWVMTEFMYKSINGGVSWTLLYESSIHNIRDVIFTDTNNGWCYYQNDSKLYKTSDGGTTWIQQTLTTDITFGYYIRGLSISNGKMILAINSISDEIPGLLISSDGISWTYKLITNKMFYINNSNGLCVYNNNIFVYGTFNELYYMPVIYKSTDGGDNWTQILNEDNDFKFKNYNSIYFFNNNVGWMLGENYTLLKTVNGGLNWVKYDLNLPTDNGYLYQLTKLIFVNDTNAIIIGYNNNTAEPIIIKTTDNGVTWTIIPTAITDAYLMDISAIDQNNMWIVGYNSLNETVLLNSTDGGENWVLNDLTLTDVYFENIHFKNLTTGYVVGYSNGDTTNGELYQTTDGGNSWTKNLTINSSDNSFYSVATTNSKLFVAATTNSESIANIYYSTNNGTTWNSSNLNIVTTGGWITTLYFKDDNNGVFIYSYSDTKRHAVLYNTTDGGLTWNISNSTVIDGDYNSISKGFIVGQHINKSIILSKIN